MGTITESWQDIAARKRATLAEKIPKEWRLPESYAKKYDATTPVSVISVPRECGILTESELDITEKYDAVALAAKVASGEFSSLAVTTAFCKRAAIAQQLTNCLTEVFFDEAIDRAKYLDEYLAREKKIVGPLHGIPVSVKDSFKYKGHEATIGYVSFIGLPLPTEHSPLLNVLLDSGAVLYAKTNIPQTLMTADSDNNVFGRTLNPHKLTLTAGGSSGGEGALVAMRGSIFGVGTDIGGSIRIPALCCGTFGFKPSTNRVPYGGQASPGLRGSPGIVAAAGPLATSFRDLKFFMESVITGSPWKYDSSALIIPWRKVEPKKLLTIGVLFEDPAFPLAPPVSRALDTAAKKLSEAGHTIISLPRTDVLRSNQIGLEYYSLDNTRASLKNIEASGEPIVPSVAGVMDNNLVRTHTLESLYGLNVRKQEYAAEWHKRWVENKLDVVLAPGAETTAVPHDTYGNSPYTIIWNLLDYPGTIIPFLKADKSIDPDSLAKTGGENIYSAEATDGAPCSVQVVARNLQDEELLQAGALISECLNG